MTVTEAVGRILYRVDDMVEHMQQWLEGAELRARAKGKQLWGQLFQGAFGAASAKKERPDA
jgi:hypothetical protein